MGSYEIAMVKSILPKKNLQTWCLIHWQHRSRDKTFLLINMGFDMDFVY